MKYIITISLILTSLISYSQYPGYYTRHVENGDTILTMSLSSVFIFPKTRKGQKKQAQYERLLRAIKLTYPIAQHAKNKLKEMEAVLDSLPTDKKRKEYVKGVEDELKAQYTPILKKMSMYQGRILLKLIDRETGNTSYALVQELRGKFAAFFWQGIARLFGANLKTEYDSDGEDMIIEELIKMYERGEI